MPPPNSRSTGYHPPAPPAAFKPRAWPSHRPSLRTYAFDPSLDTQLEMAVPAKWSSMSWEDLSGRRGYLK